MSSAFPTELTQQQILNRAFDATNNVINTSGSGGGGGGAATIADGADVTQGAIADASVTAGATGTLSAKVRRISADIGTILTNTTVSSTIDNGRKIVTTAGTAVTLAASTTCKSITITAETDNTGLIAVGGSGVIAALATRQGTPLSAGDSMVIDIDNLSKVYIDSTVNGDGVTYTYTA